MNENEEVKCKCGAKCWVTNEPEEMGFDKCDGEIQVSEDYPGDYTHFCAHHGHPEDKIRE